MRVSLLLLLVLAAAFPTAPAGGALPNVAVLDSPVASAWLTAAGIQHAQITSDQVLSGGLATVQILIVPVERIRTTALAQSVAAFVRRGGALLAVYWGPLVREGAEASQPSYALTEVVGARPVGWRGTGPVTVRIEPDVRRDATMSAEIPIPRGMLVTLRPASEARVLARWSADGGAANDQDAGIVRLGNVIFTGVNLFAPANDTPTVRQLFLWMFGMLAPNLGFEQARERAAAAMAAVIRADAQVDEAERLYPHISFAAVRQLIEQARDAAMQAKERVARERYRESGAAVDVANKALEQALQLLQKRIMSAR